MRKFRELILQALIVFPFFALADNVFVTKTGQKYHLTDCRYLRWGKISIDESEAIKLGYASCSVCIDNKPIVKPDGIIPNIHNLKIYIIPTFTVIIFSLILYHLWKRKSIGTNDT